MASFLLLLCFALLALFAGAPALLIGCFLISGTLGQAFMQIALSNSISATLPREKAGVGMGLLSMVNFLAGTISTSMYSKVLDQGAVTHWNPFYSVPGSFVYSNIYITLFALHITLLVIYRVYIRKQMSSPVNQGQQRLEK